MKRKQIALAVVAAVTLAAGAVAADTEYRRLKDEPAVCQLASDGIAGFCDGTFHRFRHSGSDRQDVSFLQLPDGTVTYDKKLSATKLFTFRYDNGVPLISGLCFAPEAWMINNPNAGLGLDVVKASDVQVDIAGMWPQALAHTGRFRITWDSRRVCTSLVLINGSSARDNY